MYVNISHIQAWCPHVVIKTGASVSNWTFALLKFSVFSPLKAAVFLHSIKILHFNSLKELI